ncbi:hypothetical protein LCGC14_1673410, partial [marine sediment metagenome]
PAAYCLKFEDFTQYFNSHIFFDRELYLQKIKEPSINEQSKNVKKPKVPKRNQEILPRELESEDISPPMFSLQDIFPSLSVVDTLTTLKNISEEGWISIREFAESNRKVNRYLSKARGVSDEKEQKRRFMKASQEIYEHMVDLDFKGYIKISYYSKESEELYHVRLTSFGLDLLYQNLQTESSSMKESSSHIIPKIRSAFLYSFSIICLYFVVLIFFIVVVTQIYTFLLDSVFLLRFGVPIHILKNFYSWLEPFIYISSLFYALTTIAIVLLFVLVGGWFYAEREPRIIIAILGVISAYFLLSTVICFLITI